MLSDIYKRWRHSKGYGVHSPYAYKIVTEVIQQPKGYSYYGYDKIKGLSQRKERRFLRMLLRLASYTDIGSVYLNKSKKNKPIKDTLLSANSEIKIIPEKAFINDARLIMAQGDELKIEQMQDLLDRPGRILLLRQPSPGIESQLFEALEEGVMFYSPSMILIISRPGIQKVKYSMKF